jgi:hypothetical protein
MDLTSKQIKTILKALQIASETVKIQHAKENMRERVYSSNELGSDAFHQEQVKAIELAGEFDSLAADFHVLNIRNSYPLNGE